jgi:hypothetical protein
MAIKLDGLAAFVLGLALPGFSAGAHAASLPSGDAALVTKVAALVPGSSRQDIVELRRDGWQWADITRVLVVAKTAGVPVSDIVWMRSSGIGWDEIAKKTGVDSAGVTAEAKFIELSAVGS